MVDRFLIAAFTALAIAFTPHPVRAQDAQPSPRTEGGSEVKGYPAVPLLSTGTTILGEKIRYPSGTAHVNASIITLPPGARTVVHKHGVPMFAYILEGEITVDYGKHGKRTYRQGDSLMEAMHVAHFGENTGTQPMRLIAVYMGANKAKDVIPVK